MIAERVEVLAARIEKLVAMRKSADAPSARWR
jgi:hypothetical protein